MIGGALVQKWQSTIFMLCHLAPIAELTTKRTELNLGTEKTVVCETKAKLCLTTRGKPLRQNAEGEPNENLKQESETTE